MTFKDELELRRELEGENGRATFDMNYIVEAGAGAGKSTTMVRRIAKALTLGVCEPEQLVAITFTVKATQELRDKLEELLRTQLAQKPGDPTLKALAESAERIQVSTIDSFCRKLLTTMPFSNPLGLGAGIETDDKLMGADFFRRRFREEQKSFAPLCARYALRYQTLEDTFLLCCGKGDHAPAYAGSNDPEIQQIESVLLPAAAKALHKGVKDELQKRPWLRQTLYREFLEIIDLPDTDFSQDGKGLELLIPYLRSRSGSTVGDLRGASYNAIMDREQWDALKASATELRDQLEAAAKGADTSSAASCMTLRSDLRTIAAQYEDFLDPSAKAILDSTADFQTDPKALDAFLAFLKNKAVSKWLGGFNGSSLAYMHAIREAIYPTVPPPAGGKKPKKPQLQPNAIPTLVARRLHGAVMEKIAPLVAEYLLEKRERTVATFNDALVLTRDMLKNDAAARAYFRERYRCYFVDEFQDTDALQTELLFYLTSEETGFCAGDWEACRLRPGSLFLVGDPKQAIYRFRGADIDTYTRVCDRFFRDPDGKTPIPQADRDRYVGKFVQLGFNFRSSKEICAFTRLVFEPLLKKDAGGKSYQAEYADMRAVRGGAQITERGDDPGSLILAYRAEEDDDPAAVAAFIKAAVDSGAAAPKDFLVLTDVKKDANQYAAALLRLDVPVNITGEEPFNATPAIASAVLYLDYLLEPDDPVRLQTLLERVYGIAPELVLRLLQRGGLYKVTDAFSPENAGGPGRKKLDAITAALSAEAQPDEELLVLCAALGEIRSLIGFSASLPALATLERLLEDVSCIWPEQGGRIARRRHYARVRQFLSALRAEQSRDFPTLARRAIALAEETAEAELPLELSGDCVRIMNVHKAKGLEGRIVILAYHKPPRNPFQMTLCRDLGQDGKPRLHVCVVETKGKNEQKHSSIIGSEDGWTGFDAEERRYQDAERLRLLYVAATRPKQMLLVNRCRSWEPIWSRIESDGAPDPGQPKPLLPKDSAAYVLKRLEDSEDDAEHSMLAALALLYPEREAEFRKLLAPPSDEDGDEADDYPFTGDEEELYSLDDLDDGESAAPDGGDAAVGEAAQEDGDADADAENDPYTPIFADALARERERIVRALAEPTAAAVTPSGLEHAWHPHEEQQAADAAERDAPEKEDDTLTDDAAGIAQQAGDALVIFDAKQAEPAPAETAPDDGAEAPAARHVGPHGPHWGTIVHRVMELAVGAGSFDGAALERFAQQAAFEDLSGAILTENERALLDCPEAKDDAALIRAVAAAAAEAAGFLSEANAPLRTLIADGQRRAELEFTLRAAPEGELAALYAHLLEYMKPAARAAAQDKPIDVRGTIDLAVRKPGGWYVVDYKTDILRSGEDAEAYRARLRSEYTPQILTYVKMLERCGSGGVLGAYLCAIPLGGELIALDLDASPAAPGKQKTKAATPVAAPAAPASAQRAPAAPTAASPAANACAAEHHPASTLLRGRDFASELQNAESATAFTLLFQGQRLTLTDKHGQARDSFKMCRDFAGAVARWAKGRHPEADCSVDFTNAGSVRVLRRLLKMLRAALSADEWDALELRWEAKNGK